MYQIVSLADLEHAVRSARLAPNDARSLVRLLEATRWHAEDWQRVWALEYERVVEQIDVLRRASNGLAWPIGLLPGDYLWHRNRTAAALADLYRDQDRKSAAFCANAGLLRAGAPRVRRRGFAHELAPNALGWMVVDAIRARDYDQIQLARCQHETRVSLVEVLTAAKAWFDAEGALPERLDQLVPRYLDALPLDRYDGSPLRYARSAPVVYSVGTDFTDDAPAVPSAADPRAPGISLAW
jgi:hypothetical protein